MLEERIAQTENQLQSEQPIGFNQLAVSNDADSFSALMRTHAERRQAERPVQYVRPNSFGGGFAPNQRIMATNTGFVRFDLAAHTGEVADETNVVSVLRDSTDGPIAPDALFDFLAAPLTLPKMFDEAISTAPSTHTRKSRYCTKPTLRGFGVEKTFTSPVEDQHLYKVESKVDKHFRHVIDQLRGKDLDSHELINNVGTDPGCIEISSGVLRSIGEAHDFFHLVSEIPLKEGLVHYSDAVCGVGGHIHVSQPEDAEGQLALWNYAKLNPWMNAFGHPIDDLNLKSPALIVNKRVSELIRKRRDIHTSDRSYHETSYFGQGLKDDADLWSVAGKLDFINMGPTGTRKYPGDMTNDNYYINEVLEMFEYSTKNAPSAMTLTPRKWRDTFEFRCFDAVHNWKEQLAHIEFAQAVYSHVEKNQKQYLKSHPCVTEMVEMFWLPYDDQATLFKQMIETLDLDWEYYKRYLKNLKPRIEMEHNAMLKEFQIAGVKY